MTNKSSDSCEKLRTLFSNFVDCFRSFRDILFYLWIPAASSVISFFLFSFVDQSIEIYHSLILEQNIPQSFFATLFVFWLSFFVWQSARLLSSKYETDNNPNHENDNQKTKKEDILNDKKNNTVKNFSLVNLPRLIGILPLLGLLIGIFKSDSLQENSYFAIVWTLICSGLIIAFSFFLSCFKLPKNKPDQEKESLFSQTAEILFVNLSLMWFSILTVPIVTAISGVKSSGNVMVIIVCAIFHGILWIWNKDKRKRIIILVLLFLNILMVTLSTGLPPLLISNFLGAISIAALSISSLTVIFSTVYNWGANFKPNRIPSVSLLVIIAVASSLFNFNDNHEIRYLKDTNIQTYSSSLEKSFKEWFEKRTDLNAFKEKGLKEYPVYVVSAQGGGIYAAYHSATALSKLHDTIPNFSDHVFAISSVSGGSLGSSVYSALVKNSQNQPNLLSANDSVNLDCKKLTLCTKAHEIINQDFLSPLFALGLFPDILQRFIPFPRINDWDRSRGLEIALEEAWKKALNTDNILAQPYYQFWHPSKRSPALVLNTTTVETGERLLFSPFTIPYSSSKTMLDFKKVEDSNIPLSTAAGLSARFPIVSSAGWFTYEKAGKKYTNRLVDGGYYDNSGLVTARDIVSALSVNQKDKTESILDELNKTYGIKPKLINLAIVDVPQPTQVVGSSERGFDGILSPLTTVLNVRNTRGSGVVAQAAYDLNRDATKPEDYRFRAFYLDKEMAKLPLGWLLSKTSQDAIEKQNPSYEMCNTMKNSQPNKEMKDKIKMTQLILGMKDKINTIANNACVANSIFMELNLESPVVPQPSKKAK